MQFSPTFKSNVTIIILVILLFGLPFITSLLLDLQLIQKFIVRQIIVYCLMLFQAFIILFLLIKKLK